MLLVSPLFSLILPCLLFSLLSLSSLFMCTPNQTYTKSARHALILTNESIKFFSCTKPNKITVSSPLSVFHKPTTTKKILHIIDLGTYAQYIEAHWKSIPISYFPNLNSQAQNTQYHILQTQINIKITKSLQPTKTQSLN